MSFLFYIGVTWINWLTLKYVLFKMLLTYIKIWFFVTMSEILNKGKQKYLHRKQENNKIALHHRNAWPNISFYLCLILQKIWTHFFQNYLMQKNVNFPDDMDNVCCIYIYFFYTACMDNVKTGCTCCKIHCTNESTIKPL